MTQSELKELKAIGAELGAAKAANDRLRGLLTKALEFTEANTCGGPDVAQLIAEMRAALYRQADHVRDAAQMMVPSEIIKAIAWGDRDDAAEAIGSLRCLLADPEGEDEIAFPDSSEPTDTFTAVDMATAAAQGFRDGQAAVEPAPAQDERGVLLAEARMVIDACLQEVDLPSELAWMAERASKGRRIYVDDRGVAIRPAQTEQQPVAVPEDFQPLETIRWWISAYTNPENGPSYQGHGMMVQMLCEYEALRIMLSSRAQQRPTAYPHEAMDKLAADRYRVGAAGAGTLHGFAVRAGDGEQELYRGSKSDCEHVARKLAGAFLDGGFTAFEHYAAPIAQTAPQGKFRMGEPVRKISGSQWKGKVVGTYSTELTPEGYCVESSAEKGSVQIYPAKALEAVE
ncbi:hypothetical protein [Pseudomonas songnenensis]